MYTKKFAINVQRRNLKKVIKQLEEMDFLVDIKKFTPQAKRNRKNGVLTLMESIQSSYREQLELIGGELDTDTKFWIIIDPDNKNFWPDAFPSHRSELKQVKRL